MADRFARTIDYLRISVTDRCNLRCRYCMPEEGIPSISHDLIMSYEEITLLVRAAASIGFAKVRLTGGEPLVRKGLIGLVESIRAIEGITDLSLTTNGVLLAEEAPRLREAGIARINISLDTLRPDRFLAITRRDLFGRVTAGIDAALDAGMDPVKINVVVIRGVNDDEILDFALLTKDRPLSVRFIEFMPITCRKRMGARPGGPDRRGIVSDTKTVYNGRNDRKEGQRPVDGPEDRRLCRDHRLHLAGVPPLLRPVQPAARDLRREDQGVSLFRRRVIYPADPAPAPAGRRGCRFSEGRRSKKTPRPHD